MYKGSNFFYCLQDRFSKPQQVTTISKVSKQPTRVGPNGRGFGHLSKWFQVQILVIGLKPVAPMKPVCQRPKKKKRCPNIINILSYRTLRCIYYSLEEYLNSHDTMTFQTILQMYSGSKAWFKKRDSKVNSQKEPR